MWVQLTTGYDTTQHGSSKYIGYTKHGLQTQGYYAHTTDRFLLKTYFWKYDLVQAIVHTEINVRANVSDFGTVDKETGFPQECAGSKGKFGFIHANSEGSGKSVHLSIA